MRFICFLGITLTVLAVCILFARKTSAADPVQPVWGFPLNGLLITEQAEKAQYTVGEEIATTGRIKNIGGQKARYVSAANTIKPFLFHEDGSPVALTRKGKDFGQDIFGRTIEEIEPGQEKSLVMLPLNELYELSKPGIYHLVVQQRVENDVLVSNLVTIKIVK